MLQAVFSLPKWPEIKQTQEPEAQPESSTQEALTLIEEAKGDLLRKGRPQAQVHAAAAALRDLVTQGTLWQGSVSQFSRSLNAKLDEFRSTGTIREASQAK